MIIKEQNALSFQSKGGVFEFKRLTAIMIAIVSALTLLCFSVSAEEAGLMYLYTYSCSSNLTISGSTATCKSSLTGYIGTTTKIEVTQTLQVKNGAMWRKADEWSTTYYSYTCDYVNNRTVYSGNKYRVKSEFKVYSGSSYETITDYSDPVST